MPGYMTIDLETDIQFDIKNYFKKDKKTKEQVLIKSKRVKSIHGPNADDPKNDFYTCIFASSSKDVSVIHKESGFKRILPTKAKLMLRDTHTLILQNGKFDMKYFWKDPDFQQFLLKGGKVWDCQIAHYLMSGQRDSFPSLAFLQKFELGEKTKLNSISKLFQRCVSCKEIINRRHERKNWWKAYRYYCQEDGRSPILIFKQQWKRAKKLGMLPIIELYNEYLLILTMMEVNGIPVDLKLAEETRKEFWLKYLEYLKDGEELAKELWIDTRLPELNINSRAHASALLFGGTFKTKIDVGKGEFIKTGPNKGKEKTVKKEIEFSIPGMGLNPVYFSQETKVKGVYKTDEEVIHLIKTKCKDIRAQKYCDILIKASKYKKMVSTYIDAFINRSVNGRVSCTYNNTKVITGRLSSEAPNLQNIPAKDEDLKIKVQGLLGRKLGWSCVSIDFSQLEIYCNAALTQDPKLISDLRNNIDFHIKRMCYAENLTYEQGYKLVKIDENKEYISKRKAAKTISFQKAYGAGVVKLAKSTGLAESVIQTIFDKENEEYKKVLDWEQNEVAKSIERSAVISLKSTTNNHDKKIYYGDIELIPIRKRDKKSYTYRKNEIRYIGYYQSPTGHRYSFEEKASLTKHDEIFRYWPPTQIKNYAVQGTAGDCQAATSAEMFKFLLQNTDKVEIVNEVHDSKWFLVKDEYIDYIVPKLCAIMSNVREIFKRRFNWETTIDFKVEAEIGKNFAEMKPYKIAE